MKRVPLVLALVVILGCTFSQPTRVGTVRGVVADPAGTPLPGVTVVLYTSAKHGEITHVTDARGQYEFLGVAPGVYRIEALLSGLGRSTAMVSVARGTATAMNITLNPALMESITITGAAPLLRGGAINMVTKSGAVDHDNAFVVDGLNLPAQPPRAFYAPIAEHDYIDAQKQRTTTFSIDVDGASYANVRRFLTAKLVPPPDAVRVEEMVNYFTYRYPQPTDGRPVAISAEVAACPWATEHRLLRVGLQAKTVEQWKLAPNNLVFLLDVSGSMDNPDRLPLVQSAMRLLVDQLAPTDTISIVVYAGAAGLVLPPTPASQKDVILHALDSLKAGGSTAGGDGIELAYKVATDNFLPNGNNRVILATDGDFNVGLADLDGLGKLIEEKRKSGVYLTCIGVGTDNLQDGRIEMLADKGNGNYYYLDTIDEAKKVFATQLTGTLVAVADDVKVQIELNPALVASYRQIGYENRAMANKDFEDDKKDAGELGSGQSVTALYEIVPARGAGRGQLATINLRYKDPGAPTSQLISAVANDEGKSTYEASPDTQFAAAVAEFGMLLRNSKHKGRASLADVAALTRAMQGEDMEGFRKELIGLVDASRAFINPQRLYSAAAPSP